MAYALVVMGASLGGMRALQTVLEDLPAAFAAPVVVVQHCGPGHDSVRRAQLREFSPLPVVTAEDKMELLPGRVYVAPADYHLLVDAGSLALSTDAPVGHSRPSIDVLFESAALAYGAGVVGVVLSGANADGTRGAATIKARGGLVLAQEPATAEGVTMPAAAIRAGAVTTVLPLSAIAEYLAGLAYGR